MESQHLGNKLPLGALLHLEMVAGNISRFGASHGYCQYLSMSPFRLTRAEGEGVLYRQKRRRLRLDVKQSELHNNGVAVIARSTVARAKTAHPGIKL